MDGSLSQIQKWLDSPNVHEDLVSREALQIVVDFAYERIN